MNNLNMCTYVQDKIQRSTKSNNIIIFRIQYTKMKRAILNKVQNSLIKYSLIYIKEKKKMFIDDQMK